MMSSESQKEYPQGEGIVVPDISAVPTVLKSILTQLKNAISVKKIRGLSPFLGLGEDKPFGIPDKTQAVRRIRHNALFFATNYAIVVAGLTIVTMYVLYHTATCRKLTHSNSLMNPIFLLAAATIVAGWMYVAKLANNDDEQNPIIINGRKVTSRERSIGMLIVTIIAVYMFGGSIIFSVMSTSGLLISAHTCFRAFPIPEEDELGFLTDLDYGTDAATTNV